MNETLNILKTRRSVRAYGPEPVAEETLRAILEAGTYAPCAMGRQSVTMVAVRDRETRDYLERENAKILGNPAGKPFYGAPEAIVVLTDPEATTAANGQLDGALAMGNLMNAAWSMGVSSCWINRAREFFDQPAGKALLKQWGLPERLQGVGICILGYPEGDIPAAAPRKEHGVLWK
jgi:nitroreductase